MNPLRAAARALRRVLTRTLHPSRRERAAKRLRALDELSTILFVCTGNICRSPYAAAITRTRLEGERRDHVSVRSAGLMGPGRPVPKTSLEVTSHRELDLSDHRSRLVTAEDIRGTDLFICMEPRHRNELVRNHGADAARILCLGDLDPERPDRRAILDPWGKGTEAFEASFDRIDRCLELLLRLLGSSAGREVGFELGSRRERR